MRESSAQRLVVADKANTLRSGCAGMGNDHFRSYIPEVHGPDITPIINGLALSPIGGMRSREFCARLDGEVLRHDQTVGELGIPMKCDGEYEFAGHALPGRTLTCLKYEGGNQKAILTREARRKGAKILSRVMVFDLIGRVDRGRRRARHQGGKDLRVPIQERDSRNRSDHPALPGPHAGVDVQPGQLPQQHRRRPCHGLPGRGRHRQRGVHHPLGGPKAFARCGKGTWVGVLRPRRETGGAFRHRAGQAIRGPRLRHLGDVFEDYARAGKGPCTSTAAASGMKTIHGALDCPRGQHLLLDHVPGKG